MQLISTEYFYANRKKNQEDRLVMIFKKKSGEKIRQVIRGTKIKYFISKEEYWDELLEEEIPTEKYIPLEQLNPVVCTYSELYQSIVDNLDDPKITSYFRTTINSGANDIGKRLSRIHLDNRLHGTDVNIEDYYINKYLKKHSFEDNNFGLTKIFCDIETDTSKYKGFPDPELAECPVNAISLVDPYNKVINEYLLSYEGNDGYDSFVKNIKSFKEYIEDKYKGEFKLNIYIFDEEIELISSFFEYINEVKPDFCSFWNADFDIPTLINRCSNLGYEPEEICCPEDIPKSEKRCYYKLDSGKSDVAEKHSTYNISGFTNYIDEMSLYANITKPLGKEESYSLDYIGEKVTGMKKEEVIENMKIFHLVNFEKFVEYSIQDSVVLAKIDEHTGHIDLIYGVSMITRTKVCNAMKKTVSLNNMIRYYAENKGLIKTNNRAKLYDRPDHKIPGAFVANSKNIDNVGLNIMNLLSKFIFDCCTDLDLSSLYPSIIRALNISLDTFIGYLELNFNGFTGADFCQDFITGDIINIGRRYFNLPGINDVYKELHKDEEGED